MCTGCFKHLAGVQHVSVLFSPLLQAYWRKGFGYRLNYEQSCPLLAHIVQHMEAAVTNRSSE